MSDYQAIYREMDPPVATFEQSVLGPTFPKELSTVSRMWFACGYRPGIASYLNFFLLRDFVVTHDTAFEPRFHSFKSMAESFYRTDLFIRDVTDSGLKPTGGVSSRAVRQTLASIMGRHQRIAIPPWMMTYFGYSLLEMVEKVCAPMTDDDRQLHLSYMAKTYRIMGVVFSDRRDRMDAFARQVETEHAGTSPHLEEHSRNILILGEMIGVSSAYDRISAMLPPPTRDVFRGIYPRVRPNPIRRLGARVLGRLLQRQAIGKPREAVPVSE